MANYSDLITMFNIRHWFEFENGSNLGLDTITGESHLSTSGPLSLLGFKEDVDYPGFPAVGQSLYANDTDDISHRNTLVEVEHIQSILATGTESIAFTAMFNFIHNEPPGSPPPVEPPGSPLPFRSYFDPSNPRLKMNGLIDKPGTKDLNPPDEPLPVLAGQSPCMPPYGVCFPDQDPDYGCADSALSLKISATIGTNTSFLAIQDTAWELRGGSFEFTENYPDDHPGEFYWTWNSSWNSNYTEISSLPIEEYGYANGETVFNFGYDATPIRLEFEIVDNGLSNSHYAGSTFLPYEQVFNVMSKSNATSMGFQEASFVIVDKDQNPDTIVEADIKLGWYAWTDNGGITVYEVIITDGVQQTPREVTSNIEIAFSWNEDKYLEYSEGYNIQSLSYWGTDQYLLDTRNIKIVAYINRGVNTDSSPSHWIRYCPMACATVGPLETPTPDMSLFNIKSSSDDIDIIVESNTSDSYLAILNNDIYLKSLIPLDMSEIFTLTASIEAEYEYPDTEFTLTENQIVSTIPNAEYLMVTMTSHKNTNSAVIDISDINDNIIHSCRNHHEMIDTVKVTGDTVKVIGKYNDGQLHISVVDQDGNKGTVVTKIMLSVYLNGALISKTEIQSPVSDIVDFTLTDQRNIEPAGSPIPIDPFRGTMAEFIITDSLQPSDAFRLHSILNGLFSTETMENLNSLYGNMFWHKFVNGKDTGRKSHDSFMNYDEMHDVGIANANVLDYDINSKDYYFSLSCPKAFFQPKGDAVYIEKQGFVRSQEVIDISDLNHTHYSTHLVHLNPRHEDITQDQNGAIIHLGDEYGTYIEVRLGTFTENDIATDAKVIVSDEKYDPLPVDETYIDAIPTNKPFVLYLGIDAVSLVVAIDGKIIHNAKPVSVNADNWSPVLTEYTALGRWEPGNEGPDIAPPPMYISDYIQHKGPLNEKKLKKISSIYHAGDPSYSRMNGQIPTIENMHHLIKTNHRLNLSDEASRGVDLVTGSRIPVTFTGSRYEKIPGYPHIEGIVLDGQPEKRACTISQIYKGGYFNTGVNKNSWIHDTDTEGQIISIGTFIHHDDLKKFNLLRWTGAINPEDNWIEIVVSARGVLAYQMSLNGIETTTGIISTHANFGLNSFFLQFSIYFSGGDLRMKAGFHFGDKVITIAEYLNITSTGITEEHFLEDIAAGSTLEIGGGKNINTYMDSNFNMSGIISDIIFFSNAWTDINDPVSMFRTLKDNPPGAIGLEKGHGGLGKGSTGSGVITVTSHDGVESGVDAMPISGTAASLLISETNDYNSPVLTMRPIIDVKVSDGFAGAPYTDTYLVPIPSCSGVDLSIFKLAVTDPFKEDGSRLSISDHSSESNYYWHAYSNSNREYKRTDQWSDMNEYYSKALEEGPFCQREGLVYDFVKYNGKIAFSFLGRYIETDKDTAYGDKDINHHSEYRGKRLYHYNHVGYLDQSLIGELKWNYKYADDGSNGMFGLLRANRNNGFIHLAGNNQPHIFNMNNFQDRLNAATDYSELCQHQQFRCNEGYGGEYGGDYGGEY